MTERLREVTSASVLPLSSSITSDEEHSLETQLAVICMFAFLSVVGILGNSFSIFLLTGRRCAGSKKILSPAYRVYIIALAIADNGMLFFTGILRYAVVDLMYETNQSSWFYEVYLCRWHRLLMHTSHNAAVWLLVLMAFDRFIAVSFPFKYREIKQDSSKAMKVTMTMFFLSFLFATPYLAVGPTTRQQERNHTQEVKSDISAVLEINGTDSFPTEQESTNESLLEFLTANTLTNGKQHYSNEDFDSVIIGCSLTATMGERWAYAINIGFHVLLAFLVPYFVLLGLNILTLRCLHYPSHDRLSGSTSSWRQSVNKKITTMMLVVCFTFIILWLPQALLLLTKSDAHSHNSGKNEIGYSLAALSGLLNSALNFVLYCLTVKKFRKSAGIYLKKWFCCITPKTLSATESLRRKRSLRRDRVRKPDVTSSRSEFEPFSEPSANFFELQSLHLNNNKAKNASDVAEFSREQSSFGADVRQKSFVVRQIK